jgi:acetolactate synthase I/II/III large subunit
VQEGIGAIILVLRDRELAQIAQFQGTALNRKTASAVHDYEVKHLAAAMHASFFHMTKDDRVEEILREADAVAQTGKPVLIDVDIDYSRKTYFTKGVVKANLHRLPFRDRARFIGRAVLRKFTG